MCLLDRVLQWDDAAIACAATSHTATDNPLRSTGRLGIAAGIEYAAQAMAVHGALLAARQPSGGHGYLASVRDVRWQVARLDDLDAPLRVRAQRLSGNDAYVMYEFDLQAAGRTLLEGRATVMLSAAPGFEAQ
ncbi:MAG: 3-hydroxylacyl-ACP dehydratase [Proteobacteria bacterium]|nr:3-hydroxylacyl-ACP dehydratase [Pseudomonadota bacterium]